MSYAPYPAYKDSGVPWLGQIPEAWQRVALKRYLETPITDGPHETPNFPEQGVPFISAEAIRDSKIDFSRKRGFISKEDDARFSKKYKPRKGDIYVVKSGATTGRVAMVETEEDFNIWSPLAAIRVDPSHLDGRYLFHFLGSKCFTTEIELGWSFGTQQNIGMGVIGNLNILLPTLEEQTAIADFLDKRTAEIDELIAKKEELLRLLAEQRTALITHAVTKGLNPNAKMKPSGIDWLGDVPEGWDVVPFKWCCQVQSGQVDPKLDEYKSLPLIAPDHIESGTGRLLPYESAEEQGAISGKYQFEAGEVLYSKIRPELSKVALAPEAGLCSADMYAIRAMDGLRPEFLFFQMLSRHFHRFAVLESMRVAMPKINRESLGVFPVIVPDEDTQGEILDHIQSELSKMDLAEEKITTARDYLKEYRSAVITNAVTGKIKVA